jgi:hypothetical protein
VNDKKGSAHPGRRRGKVRKRYEKAKRRGENWKNDILREWQTQRKPLGLHGIGGGKSFDGYNRSNAEMIENGEDVCGHLCWAAELLRETVQELSLFREYQAAESVGTDASAFDDGDDTIYSRNRNLFYGTAGPVNFKFVDFAGGSQAEMETRV